MPKPKRLTLRLKVHARNWGDKVIALQNVGVDVRIPLITNYVKLTFPPGWEMKIRANPTYLVVDETGKWRLEFTRDGQSHCGTLTNVF